MYTTAYIQTVERSELVQQFAFLEVAKLSRFRRDELLYLTHEIHLVYIALQRYSCAHLLQQS